MTYIDDERSLNEIDEVHKQEIAELIKARDKERSEEKKQGIRWLLVNYIEDEISFLKKARERLRGYHCGEHKELDKMILNRIKELK
jgi:hypothetical protein